MMTLVGYIREAHIIVLCFALTIAFGASGQVDLQDDDSIRGLVNSVVTPPISKDSLCIARPGLVGGLIIVGSKDANGICSASHGIIGADVLPIHEAGQQILVVKRWHEASPKMRAELAREWVQNGVLAFAKVMLAPDKTFIAGGTGFHGPRGAPDGKGGAVVTVWLKGTQVLSPKGQQQRYTEVQFTYSPDALGTNAEIIGTKTLDVVPAPTTRKPRQITE